MIETVVHITCGHRGHPRGRQLDGQRDTVQSTADLQDRGFVGFGQREVRHNAAGAFREQGDR